MNSTTNCDVRSASCPSLPVSQPSAGIFSKGYSPLERGTRPCTAAAASAVRTDSSIAMTASPKRFGRPAADVYQYVKFNLSTLTE